MPTEHDANHHDEVQSSSRRYFNSPSMQIESSRKSTLEVGSQFDDVPEIIEYATSITLTMDRDMSQEQITSTTSAARTKRLAGKVR